MKFNESRFSLPSDSVLWYLFPETDSNQNTTRCVYIASNTGWKLEVSEQMMQDAEEDRGTGRKQTIEKVTLNLTFLPLLPFPVDADHVIKIPVPLPLLFYFVLYFFLRSQSLLFSSHFQSSVQKLLASTLIEHPWMLLVLLLDTSLVHLF